MAFSFSIGGSKSSSKSKTTSREKSTQTTQRLSSQDQLNLRNLIAMFSGELGEEGPFTREAALADISGMVDNLFTRYSEEKVPAILSQQQQTGGYAQTTAQTLANDAFARTVAEGAGLQFGAVSQYAALNDQLRRTSMEGLGINLDALLKAQETTSLDRTVTSVTRGKGSGVSAGAGFGIKT